jgi:hypothetical protein
MTRKVVQKPFATDRIYRALWLRQHKGCKRLRRTSAAPAWMPPLEAAAAASVQPCSTTRRAKLAPAAPTERRVTVQIHPVPPWGSSCLDSAQPPTRPG